MAQPTLAKQLTSCVMVEPIKEQDECDKPRELIQPELSSQMTCRVCLSDEESSDNPLLAPCKCAGSMKHIHYECLKNWFATMRHVHRSGFVKTFFW